MNPHDSGPSELVPETVPDRALSPEELPREELPPEELPPEELPREELPREELPPEELPPEELPPEELPREELPPEAGRGAPEWRQLSFRTSGLVIELEIAGAGAARRLTGQLIPRQSATVDIRHERGVITVQADSRGRFSAEPVPFGQVSLRCHLGIDQSPIVTGWVTL